jgi:hypothetical protein
MAYFSIDELQVASPCSASWSDMTGSDTVRLCAQCEKNVYDLSLLTRAEAAELIREKEGKLCIRFYKRADGTVLTADCPKGLRALRKSYLKTRAKVLASMIGIIGILTGALDACRTSNTSQTSAVITKKPVADSVLSALKENITPRNFIMGDYAVKFSDSDLAQMPGRQRAKKDSANVPSNLNK